jgi:hypothetical protein
MLHMVTLGYAPASSLKYLLVCTYICMSIYKEQMLLKYFEIGNPSCILQNIWFTL